MTLAPPDGAQDTPSEIPPRARRGTAASSIALVLACSLLDGAAQIFLKWGANNVAGWRLQSLLSNPGLLAGYGLYGVSGLLFILALRWGELSVLYPFLGATYLWVTLCSPWFFPAESISIAKVVGAALIAVGVSLIGWSAKS